MTRSPDSMALSSEPKFKHSVFVKCFGTIWVKICFNRDLLFLATCAFLWPFDSRSVNRGLVARAPYGKRPLESLH